MVSLYEIGERNSQFHEPPPPWRRAETHLIEKHDLIEDHDTWHDARFDDGDYVEIKSCAYEYSDGRIGRFKIWEEQAFKLLRGGRVALLVYIPRGTCEVLATEFVSPSEILDVGTIGKVRKSPFRHRRIRRIPWPEIVSLDAITFGSRHHFADHYSAEEIEETMFLHPEKVEMS